jgi:hypothetical protein
MFQIIPVTCPTPALVPVPVLAVADPLPTTVATAPVVGLYVLIFLAPLSVKINNPLLVHTPPVGEFNLLVPNEPATSPLEVGSPATVITKNGLASRVYEQVGPDFPPLQIQ